MIFPIPPRNIAGRTTLAYWENFLTEEDIKTILSLPEWLNTDDARIGIDKEGSVNQEKRRTDIAWMHVTPETRAIWEKITEAIAEVNRQYFHFDIDGFYELAQLGVYKESNSGHYDWHTDSPMCEANVPRKLSMALMLSDPSEFQGGELQVKIDNDTPVSLELKRGRAWFFPSWALHRVTPVTKGVRRSLVLWAGGPPFR